MAPFLVNRLLFVPQAHADLLFSAHSYFSFVVGYFALTTADIVVSVW